MTLLKSVPDYIILTTIHTTAAQYAFSMFHAVMSYHILYGGLIRNVSENYSCECTYGSGYRTPALHEVEETAN